MNRLTESDLISAINELLPSFNPTGNIERLSGGNINHVWRVHSKKRSLIAKYAPPYIASNPDIPLGSKRIEFEAKAMKLLALDGTLSDMATGDCRPPIILAFDPDRSLLLMEDIGDYTELNKLDFSETSPKTIGERLGTFIGLLHKMTKGNRDLKKNFHNSEIQTVRYHVQYESAHEYASVDNDELRNQIKERSRSLGKSLQEADTGKCLLMGDLWPSSVFVDENNSIRLIDWEFAHYGRPLQDVGHFAAHCWMQGQIQSNRTGKNQWKDIWSAFLSEYKTSTGSEYQELIDPGELNDLGVHLGTEILIRTFGPFREGYVYDSFDGNHPLLMEAKETAIEFILDKNKSEEIFRF